MRDELTDEIERQFARLVRLGVLKNIASPGETPMYVPTALGNELLDGPGIVDFALQKTEEVDQ